MPTFAETLQARLDQYVKPMPETPIMPSDLRALLQPFTTEIMPRSEAMTTVNQLEGEIATVTTKATDASTAVTSVANMVSSVATDVAALKASNSSFADYVKEASKAAYRAPPSSQMPSMVTVDVAGIKVATGDFATSTKAAITEIQQYLAAVSSTVFVGRQLMKAA